MGKTTPLQAGAAEVDITPKAGIHLAGDVGRWRPAKLALDPLFARALVLESGGKRLCLVVLDLTIVTEEYTDLIREEAARRFGLEPSAIMVHATQTHTAPSLGHFMFDESFPTPPDVPWLRGGDPHYFDFAVERILEAIQHATLCLEPVRVGIGSGIEGRLAFNRRAVMNNGKVAMPGPCWQSPLGPTYIRYLEGPIDPEVGIVCFQNASLKMVAMLLHYTCHPVNVFPKPLVSADWPGAWAAEMKKAFGQDCVPLVINGCCGNINPWNPFDPDYIPDHQRMGRMLAETAGKVIETLTFEDSALLDWRVTHLNIPIREVEPELLAEAKSVLAEHPEPLWSESEPHRVEWRWMKAASVMSVHLRRQRAPELDYEIQAFRVGRTAIVGLPGEPFVEGQLRIKMASPTFPTYIAHCVNEYVGYLPTREAFLRGGHEVETRYWAKLVPEALDMVVAATTDLLSELFIVY